MEIILKQDVKNLGSKDEIVKVKNGYGRNYLIPNGLAIIANESNKKQLEEIKKQRAFKEQKLKEEAQKLAKKLESLSVKVGAKAGETGKIFGSVNNIMVADALKKLGIDVDRKNITLKDESIKNLGKYSATIKLHKEVIVEIEFEVVAE
ncbi:MAG: 50S ribosomal protein L9 [Bacteroidia bacterium]